MKILFTNIFSGVIDKYFNYGIMDRIINLFLLSLNTRCFYDFYRENLELYMYSITV